MIGTEPGGLEGEEVEGALGQFEVWVGHARALPLRFYGNVDAPSARGILPSHSITPTSWDMRGVQADGRERSTNLRARPCVYQSETAFEGGES